jgi:PAS domain S-box-containing protein
VLVADDNADMRQYIVRLLGEHYRIEAVSDGEAAMAAVRKCTPDLILTDVMMPRLDGFGVLKQLRADPGTSGVPVIMLSARAGEESRVEGMEAGADDYLVKPFSAKELLARVSAHLQMARLRRDAGESLRKSEERFQSFMRNNPMTAYVKDGDGRYLYVNRTAEEMFRRPREEWIGRTDFDLFPEEEARQYRQNDRLVLASHTTTKVVETVAKRDGMHFLLSFKFPLEDDGGHSLLGGMSLDITEQKRAEDALREADRRKDRFLAILAHELRNPLAPIRTALEVLKLSGIDEPTAKEARLVMERQVHQMVRLIDDLLDVSRISTGKLRLQRQRLELAAVVGNAVELVRPAVEKAKHRLTISLPAEPVHLDADPVRVAQVVSNLLTNAVKYTDEGGRIRLTAGRRGETVEISVADTGIGIPKEMLGRLFEMFVQVEESMERSKGGLGIGLWLVKSLVDLHGGTIEARSDGPGKGSEFVVRLPAAEQVPSPAARQTVTGSPMPSVGTKRRMLIVDDNVDSANMLRMNMRMLGHDVRTAHDGEAALAAAAEYRPEIMLLDIGLPKMNGYDVARHIREHAWGRDIALIALTGWGQEDDRRLAKEAGFDHHLVKPVDIELLKTLIDDLFDKNNGIPFAPPFAY